MLGARESLAQAAAVTPDFPLVHAALAEAWRSLGHQADEEAEARLAWAHASSLQRADQLRVEAHLRVARREWPRAVELYRGLYDFYPGSLDDGLKLAQVHVDAGQGRPALDTLAQLRRDVPTAARDPRLELIEAEACSLLGDYRGEDAAATKAIDKARALGASELVGDALLHEANAAGTLGDRARAARAADEAYAIFSKNGNPFSVANALRARGSIAWKRGELTQARASYSEAVARFSKLGDGDHLARALNGLAGVESDLDHHAEALRLYREELPLFEKAADKEGLAQAHLNLGQQLRHRGQPGDAEDAEKEMQTSLGLAREIGQRKVESIAYESLGSLYFARGELSRAAEAERQGMAVSTQIHDVTGIAQTRSKLAEVLDAEGQPALAEQSFVQAIAELTQLGESWRVGNAKVRLARMYLHAGRLAEAEAQARSAVDLHERAAVDTSESGAVLTRVLVAERRLPEAHAALANAERHGSDLPVQIAAAELEIAERQPERAVARMQSAVVASSPSLAERFEAELVMVRALAATRRTREAEAQRRAIRVAALQKGFVGVAKRAGEPPR